MSGPNPPGPDSEELEPGVEASEGDSEFEDGGSEFGAEPADADGQTDVYSRAYSAPESEQVSSGPYVPVDVDLYDYDSYDEVADDEEATAPRWPWVIGSPRLSRRSPWWCRCRCCSPAPTPTSWPLPALPRRRRRRCRTRSSSQRRHPRRLRRRRRPARRRRYRRPPRRRRRQRRPLQRRRRRPKPLPPALGR